MQQRTSIGILALTILSLQFQNCSNLDEVEVQQLATAINQPAPYSEDEDPEPFDPGPREPLPTEPLPAEPLPIEPLPTEPLPTEPLPTEPLPIEPLPIEPLPIEPLPIEPKPTNPYAKQDRERNDEICYLDTDSRLQPIVTTETLGLGGFRKDVCMSERACEELVDPIFKTRRSRRSDDCDSSNRNVIFLKYSEIKKALEKY